MFLTEKQVAVLDFIRDFIQDKRISPTLEEMSQYFGVSKITIYEHVKALEEKGAIRKQANKKRSIELVPQAGEGSAEQQELQRLLAEVTSLERERRELARENAELRTSVPPGRVVGLQVRGRVAAGDFIEAVEAPEQFALGDVADPDRCYMLRVEGDSMIDDHICSGDLVIVQPADTAQDNDIVLALVDDELTGGKKATIKRFFKERGRIRLQPSNAALDPIYVPRVDIQGKVVGVVRSKIS